MYYHSCWQKLSFTFCNLLVAAILKINSTKSSKSCQVPWWWLRSYSTFKNTLLLFMKIFRKQRHIGFRLLYFVLHTSLLINPNLKIFTVGHEYELQSDHSFHYVCIRVRACTIYTCACIEVGLKLRYSNAIKKLNFIQLKMVNTLSILRNVENILL